MVSSIIMKGKMAHKFFIDRIPHDGMTYDKYLKQIEKKVSMLNSTDLSETEKSNLEKAKLNLQRMLRAHKTYHPDEKLIELIRNINESQIWMLLTEDWCGDSAQNVPYIFEMAKLNQNISLRILERDRHSEIMDLYLSEGNTRSIPKLVVFDVDGNELFQWGARPIEGQDLVNRLKAEGKSKAEFLNQLHLWYGRNRGKALEQEIIALLEMVIEPSHN